MARPAIARDGASRRARRRIRRVFESQRSIDHHSRQRENGMNGIVPQRP
jgi:hypothetical protein